jgi:hypothetical protein
VNRCEICGAPLLYTNDKVLFMSRPYCGPETPPSPCLKLGKRSYGWKLSPADLEGIWDE